MTVSMVRVLRPGIQTSLNTQVTSETAKRVAKGAMNGPMVAITKAISLMVSLMVKARTTSLTSKKLTQESFVTRTWKALVLRFMKLMARYTLESLNGAVNMAQAP